MNKSRIFLYVALIFIAGALTGAFVAPFIGRTFMRPPRPQEMSRHMLERLRSDLSLTDSQVNQIRPLIEKTGREMDQLRRETTDRVRARLRETDDKISAILTPEQQLKFTKLREEYRRHHPPRHSLGGPPPPAP